MKLYELQTQLKIAVATGTVVMALNTGQAQAPSTTPSTLGPFVKQNRTGNPLREPIFTNNNPVITVVDFDQDGDSDIVAGEGRYEGGYLRYFENKRSDEKPFYIELEGTTNPFHNIQAETYQTAPAFADMDKDGDLDLILGQSGGFVAEQPSYSNLRGVEYYRNDAGTFTKETGAWDANTKTGNPFSSIQLENHVIPVLIDFDGDQHIDLVAGSYLYTGNGTNNLIYYYKNDGAGNFIESPITVNPEPYFYFSDFIAPSLADVDDDGDYDMVIGTYNNGVVRYFKQETPGVFAEQVNEWDPVAKTGNPFSGFNVGRYVSPAFVDFNQDGKPDLFVADELGYYGSKYSDKIINYYQNSGSGVFIEKDEFENPFDGVFVKRDASPVLIDLDGDADLDAVIGNETLYDYYTGTDEQGRVAYYKNQANGFEHISESPFENLLVEGNFAPDFADVDSDGDLDMISGNYDGEVVFFRNDDGIYNPETAVSPFTGLMFPYNGAARLVDIDNDQDLDLFITNDNEIRYFENTGTAQAPSYTELAGVENPLNSLANSLWSTPFLHFTDLDHDGDLDLLFNGVDMSTRESELLSFIENTGTPESPSFAVLNDSLFQGTGGARMFTVDYDGDGDLDAFAGNDNGTVSFLENQNKVANTTLTDTAVEYEAGEDPVIVEPALILSDPDNDIIIKATVSIENFQSGESLAFTQQAGITGVFDTNSGILTFQGRATVTEYQSLLRTVTFAIAASNGRQRSPEKSTIAKSISFAVYDQDLTDPEAASKGLEILINDPPVITAQAINVTAGAFATLDLKPLLIDPNGAADIDLTSLKIIQHPASGALATLDANGVLIIDYNTLSFLGTETITIEVCDLHGLCTQNNVTIIVTNTPPVIHPEPVTTAPGTTKSINLMTITSDADNNLNRNAFLIVQAPSSGAGASIHVVSETEVNLLLDYQGITFQGTDELTIRACDHAGACTESLLAIEVDVESQVVVYNAIAPSSAGDNRFMRITGLPQDNKVSIFSRWGDKVYHTESYDNGPAGNAFKGLNNHGSALPSGTYFYTIEIPGKKMITGYLTLKQ